MTTGLGMKQLLAQPLIWAVRLYQLLVSPLLVQQCRFYPSCSAYAVTALTRFGLVKGSWLALRRLARCHPWNPGGVDHVPAAPADPHAVDDPRTLPDPNAVADVDAPSSSSRFADPREGQQPSG